MATSDNPYSQFVATGQDRSCRCWRLALLSTLFLFARGPRTATRTSPSPRSRTSPANRGSAGRGFPAWLPMAHDRHRPRGRSARSRGSPTALAVTMLQPVGSTRTDGSRIDMTRRRRRDRRPRPRRAADRTGPARRLERLHDGNRPGSRPILTAARSARSARSRCAHPSGR